MPVPKLRFSTTSETFSDESPLFTPTATPNPEAHDNSAPAFTMAETKSESSNEQKNKEAAAETNEAENKLQTENKEAQATSSKSQKARRKCPHGDKQKKDKKSRKQDKDDSDDDSSDSAASDKSDSESNSESEADESSSSSEDDSRKKKSKRGKKSRRSNKKSKRSRRRDDSSEDDSDSESEESESESENDRRSKKSKKRRNRRRRSREEEETSAEEEQQEEDPVEKAREYLKSIGVKAKNIKIDIHNKQEEEEESDDGRGKRRRGSKKGKKRDPRRPAFFRGDELWDKENYQYELKPTKTRVKAEKHSDYVFTVKRHFDWEGKYEYTDVHIHGKPLREALTKVMESCKAVSLAEEEPTLEPDMLFLYLEDMRKYRKELRNLIKAQKLKKKTRKALEIKVAQLKCMIKYLDKDYATTKAALYPMLEQGTITFDLLWTLFRSDTHVYTTTYGNESEPRAFKVDYCNKEQSFTKGVWYEIVGKYFDFDGKEFGLGNVQADIESFRGVRKISSLPVYPIQYHPKAEQARSELIARGKKFVGLAGMQYKFLKSMAFMKRRGQIVKINVNGRIMCDPATFRRINPNYAISNVKREDPDLIADCESDDEGDQEDKPDPCNCADCLANDPNAFAQRREDENEPKKRWKRVRDPKTKQWDYIQVSVDDNGQEIRNTINPMANTNHDLESLKAGKEDDEDDEAPGSQDVFSDEELLIASPVILGFAFSEKMWLELSVSGIQEITWNEGAFDSLVLPAAQKDIIKALVTAHSKEAKAEVRAEAKGEVEGKVAGPQQNIDDVIQGKGKGLVSVLHGTPGTGKTLTAEGIAELLKCPLYCVSAGELGTNPQALEAELTKILDVAHAWGAVLLLDEADVFLEARTAQDIHRNALVSIFLRLLEYFQGILFLTTNRVASFDEAFQSRIHIALRYQELDQRARRKVWEMFLAKVRGLDNAKVDEFGKDDLDKLARKQNLNGRQIKNAVRSAQALALNEGVALSMVHIEKVLQVAESFERDLKGGSGYADAMRSYT